jgi:biotin operon repressor
MSARALLKRMKIVLDQLRTNSYPAKNDILGKIRDEMDCSSRTFDRVIESLRDEFGCEILYDTKKKGYFLDQKKSFQIDSVQRLITLSRIVDTIKENLICDKEALNYIQFDYDGLIKGSQYLGPILNAIKEKRKVSIAHQKYQSDEPKIYEVCPYLLKEYQGRWYLLAYAEIYQEFRTFGLHRINTLELTNTNFIPDDSIKVESYFDDVVGIVQGLSEVEPIELLFSTSQSAFIKSQPIHKSQEIISDDENGLHLKLVVSVNYELIQKIMMHGQEVKVLNPEWLAEDIKMRLKKAMQLYNTDA